MNESATASSGTMTVDCIYTDKDGGSRIARIEIPILSRLVDAEGKTRFGGHQGGDGWGIARGTARKPWGDWHTCGNPMLSIALEGEWEVEVGTGERRILGPGSVTVFLDTDGQGHRSQVLSEDGSTVIAVRIDNATRAFIERQIAQ